MIELSLIDFYLCFLAFLLLLVLIMLKSPIQYIDIGNYTVSCLPFTINCQEPKLGSLVVRCSFYEDFLEYHDVRVVLDFI